MRSEKYLLTILEVMREILQSKDRMITQPDFQKRSDIYSEKIEKELLDNGVVFTRYPRPLRSNSDSKLLAHIEKIEAEIDAIRDKESDRRLSIREKEEIIRNSRWSRWSIIISSLVALGQIIQWIVMIGQWLCSRKP